jgi:hypothetical protein
MNWVLENLIQRALNGLADIFLKFSHKSVVTTFIKAQNHPRFGRMISLVNPSSKLWILKKDTLVTSLKRFMSFKKIDMNIPMMIFFMLRRCFSFSTNPNKISSKYNKGRGYPKKETIT